MKHEIVRVRHELRRRSLVVKRTEFVTPKMLRLTLGGPELKGFVSLGADDHVKLFVPGSGGEVERRDYTPRRYDVQNGELIIDFALHEAGPATQWARSARPGDIAEIGGPRGSAIVPNDFDWYLLVGDETALPAIGRRIETLPARAKVTSIVSIANIAETQTFTAEADHQETWVQRGKAEADDPAPLRSALESFVFPEGDGFIWVAAEANVARALRRYLLDDRKHPPQWMKAAGYWVKGRADSHEKFESH